MHKSKAAILYRQSLARKCKPVRRNVIRDSSDSDSQEEPNQQSERTTPSLIDVDIAGDIHLPPPLCAPKPLKGALPADDWSHDIQQWQQRLQAS